MKGIEPTATNFYIEMRADDFTKLPESKTPKSNHNPTVRQIIQKRIISQPIYLRKILQIFKHSNKVLPTLESIIKDLAYFKHEPRRQFLRVIYNMTTSKRKKEWLDSFTPVLYKCRCKV